MALVNIVDVDALVLKYLTISIHDADTSLIAPQYK